MGKQNDNYFGMYPQGQPQFGTNPYTPQTANLVGQPGQINTMASGGKSTTNTGNVPMWAGPTMGNTGNTQYNTNNQSRSTVSQSMPSQNLYSAYGPNDIGYNQYAYGTPTSLAPNNSSYGSTYANNGYSTNSQGHHQESEDNESNEGSENKGGKEGSKGGTSGISSTTTDNQVNALPSHIYQPTYATQSSQPNYGTYIPAQTNYQAVDALGYPLFNRGGLASIPIK
jgi:hypothetical protein